MKTKNRSEEETNSSSRSYQSMNCSVDSVAQYWGKGPRERGGPGEEQPSARTHSKSNNSSNNSSNNNAKRTRRIEMSVLGAGPRAEEVKTTWTLRGDSQRPRSHRPAHDVTWSRGAAPRDTNVSVSDAAIDATRALGQSTDETA